MKQSLNSYSLACLLVFSAVSILAFSPKANAQHISAFSKSTKQPVPDISICFSTPKSRQQQCYSTNTSGEVANTVRQKSLLTIQGIGYKTVVDSILPGEAKQYYLEEDYFNLDQVVVTGTMTRKTLKNTPVITQVVTAKQIEDRGLSDVQTLLTQEVPGLVFQEGAFTSVDMQGLGAKHVLFLIDGERVAGEMDGNIDYTRINVNSIERIEIVKGASSALYGSQAMGGVVNIITKSARSRADVAVGGKFAQRNEHNFRNTPSDHPDYKFRKNVDKQNYNTNLSVGLSLGKLKSNTDVLLKSGDGYRLYDKKGMVKYYKEFDKWVEEPLRKEATSIVGIEDVNISQKLQYRLNDRLAIDGRASYYELSKYDFVPDHVYEFSKDITYGGGLTYRLSQESTIAASIHADTYSRYNKRENISGKDLLYKNGLLQPRLLYTSTIFKNQVLTAGGEYSRETLEANRFKSIDSLASKSQWSATAFLQDDWAIAARLNAVAGIRVDYHQAYGWNATPKLSLMYNPGAFIFRVNYAMGYRSPSIKELYMEWGHMGMFTMYGNENLEPEKNTYLSFSTEYAKDWMNVAITAYSSWFRDKIEAVWSMNQSECHYRNIGESRFMGTDLTAKVKILRGFYANGSFSYLNNRKSGDGMRVSAASPVSGNMRLEYSFIRKNYSAIFNLTASYMGKKKFDVLGDIVVDGKKTDTYYQARMPSYSMWGAAVTQHFYNAIRLTVGVDNLFDHTADIVSFNSSTSPGRRFFVALNLHLNSIFN